MSTAARAQQTEIATKDLTEVSADDYQVYQAILDNLHLPFDDVRVGIFNRTLEFGCNDYSAGVPLANGCSFMAVPPDTTADVKALVKSNWKDMPESMWDDFEQKNSTIERVDDSFKTQWKHRMDGEGVEDAPGWDPPNFIFFFSRVGFDDKKTEAMVYVLLFSYEDNVPTGGDYFRLRLSSNKEWEIDGRIRYFEKDQDQAPPSGSTKTQ